MVELRNNNEIPTGWIETTLGAIVKKESKKAIPTEMPNAIFIGMDCIPPNSMKPAFYYSFGDFKSSGNLFSKDQILYGRMRPYLNKVFKATFDGVCSGEFIVLNSGGTIAPNYLTYILHNNDFVRFATSKTSGDRPRISFDEITDYRILLPPLPEQNRIVEKLDELLSELEKGKEQLQLALEQLKVYRQAVLKWAFEGRLTEQNKTDSQLPDGWEYRTVEKISSILGDGLHGTPQYSDDGEYYFINGNNLSDSKIEIKANTKRVSNNEYEKYRKPLNENTVLVSINGSIGYTAFYNNEKIILGKSACYFNVVKGISKYYVRYYIKSNNFIAYANKEATGSTIKNLSLRTMRNFQIPFPPNIEEQNKIVHEIEKQFSICQNLEKMLIEHIAIAEALKKSLLNKAFEGKLVPQDPSDEPASVLLERIKKEREAVIKTVKQSAKRVRI